MKERQAALKKGKMVFYDGKQKLVLDLVETIKRENIMLQGLYKVGPKDFIALRSDLKEGGIQVIFIEKVIFNSDGTVLSSYAIGSTSKSHDLGHMLLTPEYGGRGLALKTASKAERNVRARAKDMHSFGTDPRAVRLFEKLGYKRLSSLESFVGLDMEKMWKGGKFNPKDNLNKYHRIEAIDPKTGKAKMFTFPVKKGK